MKHFISLLLAAIIMISCAYLCFADEGKKISVNFDDGDLGIFALGQCKVLPEIVDREGGGKCVRFYNSPENAKANPRVNDKKGNYVSGGTDCYLDWNDCALAETFGQQVVIEVELMFNDVPGFDWEKYEGQNIFQLQVKSYCSDGTCDWLDNSQPALIRIHEGKPGFTAKFADKIYAFRLGRWYDAAVVFDFQSKIVTGYVDGNKAYMAELDPKCKDIVSYREILFGQPDAQGFPFDCYMDNVRIFSGTRPDIDFTHDIEVDPYIPPSGDVTDVSDTTETGSDSTTVIDDTTVPESTTLPESTTVPESTTAPESTADTDKSETEHNGKVTAIAAVASSAVIAALGAAVTVIRSKRTKH